MRSNELIALPIDAPTPAQERARAVPVDFLGQQALMLPGSVMVAQHTGSPVLPLILHRLADWRHQILDILPPVALDSDAVKAFKHCMVMLEAPIRRNLAGWDFWDSTEDLVNLGLLPTQE